MPGNISLHLSLAMFLASVISAAGTPCAIEGHVYDRRSGAPIRKSTVIVSRLESLAAIRSAAKMQQMFPQTTNQPETALSREETSADGKFCINAAPPGDYRITADKPGFLGTYYGARAAYETGTIVHLAAATKLSPLALYLSPTQSIQGRIKDEEGEPVTNGFVAVFKSSHIRGRRRLVPAGGTSVDDLGAFHVSGLGPGQYYVRFLPHATSPPAASASLKPLPTFYPSALGVLEAVPLELSENTTSTSVDIVPRQGKTQRIRGRILSADRLDSPGGGLTLQVSEIEQMSITIAPSGLSTNTTFEFANIPQGSYQLSYYGTISGVPVEAHTSLLVGEADVEGVDLVIQRPQRVNGRFIGSDPIPDDIEILFENADSLIGPVFRAKATKEKTFTIANVVPGRYFVRLHPANVEIAAISNNGFVVSTSVPVTVKPGRSEIDLQTVPVGLELSGTVDMRDKTDALAIVLLLPAQNQSSEALRTALTDASGTFVFKGVAPGHYFLFASLSVPYTHLENPKLLDSWERTEIDLTSTAGNSGIAVRLSQ